MQNKKPKKAYKIKAGENIRIWREIKGFKQADLAKRINISPEALSNIENGVSVPNIERLEDIADALGIEVSMLILNPLVMLSFKNNNNGNRLPETPDQNTFDKDLLHRVMAVMEKITAHFTTGTTPKIS